MGGFGSGRSPQKFSVEDCRTFDLPWLLQNGYLDGRWTSGGCTWRNALGPVYSLSFSVARVGERALRFGLITTRQQVAAHATPLHFGGLRWWFDCPGCRRRCTKLYLPPGSGRFLCRICHGLTYQSRRMNNHVSLFGRRFDTRSLKQYMREKNWFRHPPWRRKRDRRPDYRDRGWRMRQNMGDRILF